MENIFNINICMLLPLNFLCNSVKPIRKSRFKGKRLGNIII
jgi:hypothetical protein